jgi:hypothetical protein
VNGGVHLGELIVYGETVLKIFIRKYVWMWAGFIWLRTRFSGRLLLNTVMDLGVPQMIYQVSQRIAGYQEGLFSTGLMLRGKSRRIYLQIKRRTLFCQFQPYLILSLLTLSPTDVI